MISAGARWGRGLVVAALGLMSSWAIGCLTSHPGTVKHMREVANVNTAPGADDAVVIFIRPDESGGGVQSSVFEVDEREPTKLVGIVAATKKVAHRTTPGKHVFMAMGNTADFITADLEAGKLYYVQVVREVGGFTLQPVRSAERRELTDSLARTRWVELTPDSLEWARDNAREIDAKRIKYYGIWRQKPSFERLALRPEDGQ